METVRPVIALWTLNFTSLLENALCVVVSILTVLRLYDSTESVLENGPYVLRVICLLLLVN